MAYSFGRHVPDGWRVRHAAEGLVSAQLSLHRAAPYVEAIGAYDNPAAQLGADLEEVRSAVETDLLAQNAEVDAAEAARSVTPGQIAHSIGSVLGRRLFAPQTDPQALRTPLLRDLAAVYARQRLGPEATPADILKDRLPSAMILKAAAPEILQALGFAPDHPMVVSADRGGFVRGAGKMFAGGKLSAITRTPELLRHVQATLPPSGEQLRDNFAKVQAFLGTVTGLQVVSRPA
jgi:hypothetical protein